MAKEVHGPDGRIWEIGVERPGLMPKWRGSFRAGAESLEAGGWAMELAEIPAIGIVFLVIGLAIILLSVVGFVVLPLVLFVIELVVLIVGAVIVVPYRWFRGEHTVVARTEGEELRWRVGNLGEAREATESAATSLQAGSQQPVPTVGELVA